MTRDELIEKLKAIDFDHEVVLADQIGRRLEIDSVKRVDSAPRIEIRGVVPKQPSRFRDYPMAKRKKIYATREAILKDIDAARRKMKRLRKQSLEHDGESKIWFSMGNEVNANNEMDESARLWRKASRIENTRLKRLGATLAMFDTVPLGGDGLDKREVVLQNL